MAAEWIKDILRLAMAVGLAGARAPMGASMLSGGLPGAGGGIPGGGSLPPGADEFAAKQYPNEFAPEYNHMYKVVNIPGAPNFNQHGKADAATIREAGRMQTIKEHNDTLLKYIRPGMTPRQMRDALNRGAEEEKRLPQFWNESKSRRPVVCSRRHPPDSRRTHRGGMGEQAEPVVHLQAVRGHAEGVPRSAGTPAGRLHRSCGDAVPAQR